MGVWRKIEQIVGVGAMFVHEKYRLGAQMEEWASLIGFITKLPVRVYSMCSLVEFVPFLTVPYRFDLRLEYFLKETS